MADPTNNSGGLFGMDPSLLLNLGIGLLSAGGKNLAGQGNVGTALQGGLSNYYGQAEAKQRIGMGNLQYQQMAQEFPLKMDAIKAVGQYFHSMNNDPQLVPKIQGLMGDVQGQAGGDTGSPPAPPGIAAPNPQGPPPNPQGMAPQPQGATPMPQGAPQQGMPQMPPQAGLQGGGNPMALMGLGAYTSMLGLPGQGLQELAKTQLQYDPRIATQMEAAKSPVAVIQQQIQAALASGNRPLAEALYNGKLQQDLGLRMIAERSGMQTNIDPHTGQVSTFSPGDGIQTQGGAASLIPGFAQARGTIAGAEAQGRATGETVELTDPNSGAKYMVPKSVITGGGGGGSAPRGAPGQLPRLSAPAAAPGPGASPSAPSPLPGAMSGLPPAKDVMLKGNAEAALATNKEFQTKAEDGQQIIAQTQAILNSSNDFTPGKFADTRASVLEYLNATGLITGDEKKALGSYQEGSKISIQLQAMATKALGNKEASQVFSTMGRSVPNLTLSQDGLNKIGAWQIGMAQYSIARAQDINTKAQANDAVGVNQTQDRWISNSNPLYYVAANADPKTRTELLSSMKNRAQFVNGWRAAYKAGYAPLPQ
jgi:hypothetical protein